MMRDKKAAPRTGDGLRTAKTNGDEENSDSPVCVALHTPRQKPGSGEAARAMRARAGPETASE